MCVGLSFMSSEENVRYVVAVYGVVHVSERIFSFVCVCACLFLTAWSVDLDGFVAVQRK